MKAKFENFLKGFNNGLNKELDNSGVSGVEDYNPTIKESTRELLDIMHGVVLHSPDPEREFNCPNRKELDTHAKGQGTPVTGVNDKLDVKGIKLSNTEKNAFIGQVDEHAKYGFNSEKGRIISTAHEEVIQKVVLDERDKLIAKANRLEADGLMNEESRNAYKININSHNAGAFAHFMFGVAKKTLLCSSTALSEYGEITDALVEC